MLFCSLFKRSLSLLSLFFTTATLAQVKLPSFFSGNIVLQSGKPVTVCGYAPAGETAVVSFGKQKKQTKANDAGNWKVESFRTDTF